MVSKDVALTISSEIVQPIVEAKIQAAIVAALGEDTNLIEKMVTAALTAKCDHRGKSDNYGRYRWLELMCSNAIQEAAKKGVAAFLEKNTGLISAQIEKELGRSKSKTARAFVAGMTKCLKTSYRININAVFDSDRDD